ncbi:SAM-dependent methyltransferase [Saccharopolyspora gloriosae]|uniref:SAM-dependent methyltransferase n=1 Tax=Saccharopolyspora gloriosae TaxID=455344 RepID=UPI001FB6C878|nr:SAM-dependent methyltransferase [Saccharopolyspora gloriosae]
MSTLHHPVEAMPADMRDSVTTPSAARVYDWYLGGAHNWAIDRAFGQRVVDIVPGMKSYCRANRRFLNRVVRYALDTGIRQFVDIGSGLPTVGNVHEVAELHRTSGPTTQDVRVVYVDNDPVVQSLGGLILDRQGDPLRHRALRADPIADPDGLWPMLSETGVLRLDEPICLLMLSMLHFSKDVDRPHDALDTMRNLLPGDSLLAVSHWTTSDANEQEQEQNRQLVELYEQSTHPGQLRGKEEIQAFFGDFVMVEPGLVYAPRWRSDDQEDFIGEPERSRMLAGLARKA